jgi:hypothetical protein
MGMTWKFKVQKGVFALGIVAALAMASGANWFGLISIVCNFFGNFSW